MAARVATLLGAALLVVAVTAPANAASTVTCRYVILNSWTGGFNADLYITNTGTAPIYGWTVHWTFTEPATKNIGAWNAVMTQQESVITATNVPWNVTIPPGSTASFGWTATARANDIPTDITVNGVPC